MEEKDAKACKQISSTIKEPSWLSSFWCQHVVLGNCNRNKCSGCLWKSKATLILREIFSRNARTVKYSQVKQESKDGR